MYKIKKKKKKKRKLELSQEHFYCKDGHSKG